MSVSRATRVLRASLAVVPLLALPSSVGASPELTISGGSVEHGTRASALPGGAVVADNDGIVTPGEEFGVIARFKNTGDEYEGGRFIVSPQASAPLVEVPGGMRSVVAMNGEAANDPSFPPSSNPSYAESSPFQVKLLPGFECGANVPLRIESVQGTPVVLSTPFTVPTGAPGAIRRYESSQIGGIMRDGGTIDAAVVVPADATNDFVRGAEVTIKRFEYRYTARWLKFQLVSPDGSGEPITLFDDTATQAIPARDAALENQTYENITFVSKGDPRGLTRLQLAADPSLFKSGAVIQADDDINALVSGRERAGTWKLRIVDVPPPSDARRLPKPGGAGRSLTGDGVIGELGAWEFGVQAAVCGANAATPAGPDAWFGGPEPVVIDPVLGGTLSAAGSVSPKSGDPAFTPPTVAGYAWDTHTGAAPASYTDGSTSSINIPGQTRGTKVIKLKVTDSNGRESTVSRTILISELPTVDSVVANPESPQAGIPVTVTATVSDSAGAAKIAKVQWDTDDDGIWEDGSIVAPVGVSAPNSATAGKTVTFTQAGIHVVRVKVTNDLGATATKSLLIATENIAPVGRFVFTGFAPNVTPTVKVGQAVGLDGSTSTDSDGTINEWAWNSDAGTTDAFTATGLVSTHSITYTEPGMYDVVLRVTDNLGKPSTVTKQIKVTAAPVGMPAASTLTPTTGQSVTFTSTGSNDPDGTITGYAWSFTANGAFDATGDTVTRSFPSAGNITVRLRVTDNDGVTDTKTLLVRVSAPPAVVVPPVVVVPPGGTPTGTTPGAGTGTGPEVPQTAPGTTPGTQTEGSEVSSGDPFRDGPAPPDTASTANGFLAKLGAGSKLKAAKAIKKGIAVSLSVNAGSSLTIKAMITKKDAAKLGLKSKVATVAIGSGKLKLTKAGKGKLVVKLSSKYRKYVKKSKKVPVVLRAVVTSVDGDQLALSRTIYLVK